MVLTSKPANQGERRQGTNDSGEMKRRRSDDGGCFWCDLLKFVVRISGLIWLTENREPKMEKKNKKKQDGEESNHRYEDKPNRC